MRRSAGCILATLLLLSVASSPRAQGVAAGPAIPDPPDTEYFTGDQPLDPAVERQLPVVPRYRAFLPVSVDLSERMPRPGSQGKLNSCQAWATAYAARSYYTSAVEGRDVAQPVNLPSPSYIYHLAREKGCEGGSNIIRTVDVLKRGALSLAEYPYAAECAEPARPEQVAKATDFRVRGFRRVDRARLDDVKGQLARSNPVIISFRTTPQFHKHRGAETFRETSVEDTKEGWHAMTLVGYDDGRQAFRLINSWGQGWGDRGYAWVSYEVFNVRVRSAWVLDVAQPARPVPPPTARLDPAPAPAVLPKPQIVQPAPPPAPQLPPPVAVPRPQAAQSAAPPPAPPSPAPSQPKPQPAVSVTQSPLAAPAPQPPAAKARLADLQILPCGKVVAQTRGDRTVLAGFVESDGDLSLVKRVADDVPNTTVGEIRVAPWPQCELLQTLEKPLAAADQPKIALDAKNGLREGDTLGMAIQPPSQISYVYVAYVQADGTVVNLAQPRGVVPEPTLPNQTLQFGDGKQGRAKFTVSRPFGHEMIIAISSRSPLFEQRLPARQTEREYLSALRRALIYKPSPDMPDREVTASVRFLQTQARAP